jgi:hypothetical protein
MSNISVYDLEFGENVKHSFLFKETTLGMGDVFLLLESTELRPLSKSILEHMYNILSSRNYSFVLRNNGKDYTMSIEEDSEKFSESFVSNPTLDELIQHILVDKDCNMTIRDLIFSWSMLSDLPEVEIIGFSERCVSWEVETSFYIGGDLHHLKFQTKELHEEWKKKVRENNGCILTDLIWKIYEDANNETYVWYFVNEEERKTYTGK